MALWEKFENLQKVVPCSLKHWRVIIGIMFTPQAVTQMLPLTWRDFREFLSYRFSVTDHHNKIMLLGNIGRVLGSFGIMPYVGNKINGQNDT